MSDHEISEKPPLWPQLKRALANRCPACGQGRLFRGYLKQVESCSECGESYGHIRADDGPAWLTILVTGHILVPLILEGEKAAVWPLWVPMVLWPSLAIILSLLILPFAKAFFITILWRKKKLENS